MPGRRTGQRGRVTGMAGARRNGTMGAAPANGASWRVPTMAMASGLAEGLTEGRRAVLRALCDTFFPAVEPAGPDDADGFWGRRASDMGVDAAVGQVVTARLGDEARAGLIGLLDALAQHGFDQAPPDAREGFVGALEAATPAAAAGITALRRLTLA